MLLRRWKARGILGMLELYDTMCNMLYNTLDMSNMFRYLLGHGSGRGLHLLIKLI